MGLLPGVGGKGGGQTPAPPSTSSMMDMSMLYMMMMQQAMKEPEMPDIPEVPEAPPVQPVKRIDWGEREKSLRARAKADYVANRAKKHTRRNMIHGSLLGDEYYEGDENIPVPHLGEGS